jgi:hypothetical protein
MTQGFISYTQRSNPQLIQHSHQPNPLGEPTRPQNARCPVPNRALACRRSHPTSPYITVVAGPLHVRHALMCRCCNMDQAGVARYNIQICAAINCEGASPATWKTTLIFSFLSPGVCLHEQRMQEHHLHEQCYHMELQISCR